MEIVKLGIISIGRFTKLATSGSLHLRQDRLGQQYRIDRGGSYAIFRETINDKETNDRLVVLVVGFRLILIRSNSFFHWLFQRLCILTTPFWSGFRGFKVKLWMVNPKTKDYLGIYKWGGGENAVTYAEALVKILHLVSTGSSVWYEIKEEDFEKYLTERKQ